MSIYLTDDHPQNVAAQLREQTPEIIRQWELAVRAAVPAAKGQERPALTSSLPDFLTNLAQRFSPATHPEGAVPAPNVFLEHGEQRAQRHDYSLDQLLLEYRLLRKTTVAVLEVRMPLGLNERDIITDAIEEAMSQAASQFASTRELTLRESEERLRRVSTQARCLLWSAEVEDHGGELLEWDMQFPEEEAAERFFPVHREPGQPYQQAWYFSRLEEDRQRTDAYGNSEVRAGRSYSQEFRCRRRDGEVRWLAEDVQIEMEAPGRWRAVGVCLDITDRKRLEEALQNSHDLLEQQAEALMEAHRLKDEFLAVLGHELRSPLGAISNALHLLDQIGSQEEGAVRQRDIARRQVCHLTRLAEDLLDVSRIARGSVELRQETVDLRTAVSNAIQTSQALIDACEHDLQLSLPPVPLQVLADAVRLEQVVTNLLNNAAKYTNPGGRIRLTVEQEGEHVVIRVWDTGRGIPPGMLRRVFDPFTQVRGSLDSTQGGLGLGLSLVRRLVELHGGSVAAHSEGVGKGSEFVVRLPLRRS